MKYFRYSLNMKLLNLLCFLFFIPFFVVFIKYFDRVDFYFFVIYFFWMFFHEFLHGVGFYINGNINFSDVVYGACLEKGIFYCMCKNFIGKNGIIISLLFPFFFLGIFTFFLGFFLDNSLLILLSVFNIVGCVGDLVMFFGFLKLPNFSYVDLSDCTGFVLVSESDLSKYKLFGMKVIESGDLNDLNLEKNFNRFEVSKFSFFIFILMFLFLVLSFYF